MQQSFKMRISYENHLLIILIECRFSRQTDRASPTGLRIGRAVALNRRKSLVASQELRILSNS